MAQVDPLGISGAAVYTPRIHGDERGTLHEWFRGHELAELRFSLNLAQANCSVSQRGVLRGVHFADVPPGQAKWVTCIRGAVQDVVVDVRVGSPTFGQWESVRLDDQSRRAVFLAEGLGHAFLALSDEATVIYLCSEPYNPAREHGIHPLDPELSIDWAADIAPQLSPRDAAAISFGEAQQKDILPDYQQCLDYYAKQAPDYS